MKNVETYLNFLVTAPRKLQLSSIALRWHQLLVKTLSDTVENMTIVQIKEDYRLHATTQPRVYSSMELKQLEANREFILLPLPARDTESVLALVSERCAIELFTRPEAFTLNDRKKIERLNLTTYFGSEYLSLH